MFAELIALGAMQLSIPLGPKPRVNERERAPIEQSGPLWARVCGESTDWNKAAPPVRVHANTYYVGTCGISAILVTGSDGHILIDSGTEAAADLVADNIRELGFRLSDVKYILVSHEHHDHVGGIARLQQLTRAPVIASAPAARVLVSGRAAADDPQFGKLDTFPGVEIGRTIGDGGQVRLGDIAITAHATPGHTSGAMSWTWESCAGAVCRSIAYLDSLSAVSREDYQFSAHPDVVASFRASLAKVAGLRCEVLLTPHPDASATRERFAAGKRLLDEKGCADYAALRGKQLDERLAKEAAK